MTILMTKLPSLEAEQYNLPGLSEFLTTIDWSLEYPEEPAPQPSPGPDQLYFGPQQEPLGELNPAACQLPLLEDPPVWAAQPAPAGTPELSTKVAPPPSSRPRKSRPARTRTGPKLSRGQMTLF